MSDRTKLCLSDADVMEFMMESRFCETGIKYVAKCVSEFFSDNKNNRSKFRYNTFPCDDITLEELNLFQMHANYEDDPSFEESYVEGMNKLLEWAGFFQNQQNQKRQPMMKTNFVYNPSRNARYGCHINFHIPASDDCEVMDVYVCKTAYGTVDFSDPSLGHYSVEYKTRYFSVHVASDVGWDELLEKVADEQSKFSSFIRQIVEENNKNLASKPQNTTLFIHV